MATDYNILIKRFNGSDWDSFYPQSWKLIKSTATAISSFSSATVNVSSGKYYGKTLAIEISVGSSGANYNKTILFVTLGSLTTNTVSASYMRNNASFTSFDGQFLNTISFRVRASSSTNAVNYIYLENFKSLSGSFYGSEISWETTPITVYNTRIWLVQ